MSRQGKFVIVVADELKSKNTNIYKVGHEITATTYLPIIHFNLLQ